MRHGGRRAADIKPCIRRLCCIACLGPGHADKGRVCMQRCLCLATAPPQTSSSLQNLSTASAWGALSHVWQPCSMSRPAAQRTLLQQSRPRAPTISNGHLLQMPRCNLPWHCRHTMPICMSSKCLRGTWLLPQIAIGICLLGLLVQVWASGGLGRLSTVVNTSLYLWAETGHAAALDNHDQLKAWPNIYLALGQQQSAFGTPVVVCCPDIQRHM